MDEQRPWERQKGERNLWYDRFERFRLMGPTRSLRALYGAERAARGDAGRHSLPSSWSRAVETWQWVARAEAWDQAERERVQAEWRERQDSIRAADYGAGQELRALAGKILAEGPKFVRATRRRVDRGRPRVVDKKGNVLEPGEPEREVVTLALQVGAALKALDLGSKLERQAADMAPPRQALELTGKGGKDLLDVQGLVGLLRQAEEALGNAE